MPSLLSNILTLWVENIGHKVKVVGVLGREYRAYVKVVGVLGIKREIF